MPDRTPLTDAEVDRLRQEAEAHASEDAEKRAAVETRNQAESLAYSAEKMLADNAAVISDEQKQRVNDAIAEVRAALAGTDAEAIATKLEALSQAMQEVGAAVYGAQQAANAPGGGGGANWSPTSFDPRSGLVYVPAMHWPMRYTVKEIPASSGKPAVRYTSLEPVNGPRWGTLSAIDTRNDGRIRWQVKTPEPLLGGVLSTAGNVLFTGEGSGAFSAFDSASGERLWQFNCGAGVNAPPAA